MKLPIILTFLLFLLFKISSGQIKKSPKDFAEAIAILQRDCPDSLKTLIKRTGNDSLINLCYPWDGDFKTIYDWTAYDNKKSKIKKYLIKQGISSNEHQQTVILLAFKETLLGKTFDEKKILAPYQRIEYKWAREDSIRFTADTLRGVYIPKDLEDCFRQIDSFWSDSTKVEVKAMTEDEFTGATHLGFGMWIRNNWQLWGGSRLSEYFNKKGIYHPDDMSGIILDSYHRYLTGKEINLKQQIDYYKAYWKVSKDPTKDMFPKGEKKLEFNTKYVYNLKEGNIPACVHIQTNSKTDKVWIYDYHFGWKQLNSAELKRLDETDFENREQTIRELFGK